MEKQKEQQSNQTTVKTAKSQSDNQPADTKKVWGIIGYIFPILFFIPLVMDSLKTNAYSKFHANQQFILFLTAIIVNVIGEVIPVLKWFILPIGSIALFVLAIIGVINASKGKTKPLPIIGRFHLIK
jgi:uncharacterized membrane protein